MSDLRDRLRGLDSLDAPDIWERATKLDPRGPTPGPASKQTTTRLVAGVVALAVFLAAGAFAWIAFRPDRTPGIIPTSPLSIDGSVLWPERTGSQLGAVQLRADNGDPAVGWRLDPQQVTVRFAEDVLGWGAPDGRYAVSSVPDEFPPGTVEFSLDRYAIPCPSPVSGALSDCPPPFERQFVMLGQEATVGEGGVWSVTQAQATHIELNIEPGDQLVNGSRIDGTLDVPATDPPTVGKAGVQVGTEGDCFIGTNQPQSTDFTLAVRFPEGTSCESQPAYAWAATEPSGQVEGLTNPDPLSSSGDQGTLYGLTAVPFVVAPHPNATIATSSPPPASRVSSDSSPAADGEVTSSAVIQGGDLRCTATFPSDAVVPGEETQARVELTNIAGIPVDVTDDEAHLLIDRNGQQLIDSSVVDAGSTGGLFRQTLPPDASMQVSTNNTTVMWEGQLEVTPVCNGQPLPPVTLQVQTLPTMRDADVALQRAVSDAGAFTNCAPGDFGSWSRGSVHPSSYWTGHGAPTVTSAKCGSWIVPADGFMVIVLGIVTPADASIVDLLPLSTVGTMPTTGVVPSFPSPTAVSWWVYVVTADKTTRAFQRAVVDCGSFAAIGTGVAACPGTPSQGLGPTGSPTPSPGP